VFDRYARGESSDESLASFGRFVPEIAKRARAWPAGDG
jgi:hypothetical protein